MPKLSPTRHGVLWLRAFENIIQVFFIKEEQPFLKMMSKTETRHSKMKIIEKPYISDKSLKRPHRNVTPSFFWPKGTLSTRTLQMRLVT
jgi:hypothetical protein